MRWFIFLALATPPACAQVSVLTYHNDLARTGQNLSEMALTPESVSSGRFGKLFNYSIDGEAYAQPLYVPGVNIPGKGLHNVVYVATEHDSVFAFDADSQDGANGAPLWQTSFTDPADGITTVPAQNTGCGQIAPEIGISGTPVIDANTGTLYAVAMTLENGSYHQRLHALDITTGAQRHGSPVEIQATSPGTGEGGSLETFNPKNYKQRPGLLLLNGVVYTAWSSHCDIGTYHGWIIGYDASTLRQTSVFNSTPNGGQGSFWQSGAAPAADAQGNIYVISANGSFDANTGGPNLGESFLKLTPANGLSASDYFTPYNQASLSAADLDTGSSGALLLPDSAGTPAHPHLLVSAGKEARIYLIDRDNMGHFQAGGDSQIPQSITGAIAPLFGIPAYFNNTVYFSAAGDWLKAFSMHNGLLSITPTSRSSAAFGYPGSTPVISANGTNGAIVWALEPTDSGTLHAYDASNLATELYNSNRQTADKLNSYVKYSSPMVANAKVYAGTANSLVVYGLAQAVTAGGLATTNAASFSNGPIAPGSLISLFGQFNFPSASASVRINGVLAQVLYSGPTQINAVSPREITAGQNTVVVSSAGQDYSSGVVMVSAAAPYLFVLAPGQAAAINQDNSINGPAHPAPVGSIISVYLTGLGALSGNSSVTASVDDQSAQILYAGPSPGSPGLYQVNLQVPAVPSGSRQILVEVGPATSNAAYITVQ